MFFISISIAAGIFILLLFLIITIHSYTKINILLRCSRCKSIFTMKQQNILSKHEAVFMKDEFQDIVDALPPTSDSIDKKKQFINVGIVDTLNCYNEVG